MTKLKSLNTLRTPARGQHVRAALVGTGYIADFHALALREIECVELVSVCDANLSSARNFAAIWGIPAAFDSIEVMLREQNLDSIHVLVPPDQHYSLAKLALLRGVHVFIEKPMCTSVDQADELLELAHHKGLRIGVNHNMLYAGAYERLRGIVHSGALGPLDYVSIAHFLELSQIRLGPFESWMLRKPGNIVLEIGPHLLSVLIDLVGVPDHLSVKADRELDLPGGAKVSRRWRVQTTVGRTAADINMNFGPGFSQRTINVHGLLGTATLDFDANTCIVDRRTPLSLDLDRFKRTHTLANQLRSQAWHTLSDYVLTKLKLQRRGNPYQVTFLKSVASFYSDLLNRGVELDDRIKGRLGRETVECCEQIIATAGFERSVESVPRHRKSPSSQPTVLVTGPSGFIGRDLIRQLLEANYTVRALVRNSGAMLESFDMNQLEIVRGDLRSEADIRCAIDGIEYVYHLAHTNGKTWEDNLKLNVDPTRLIAEACIAAGVKRFVYTSTIDAYYAGSKAGIITEQTPLDQDIERRNYYARSKAVAESILMEMHLSKGLPLVIFRPGIVVGPGGNPFHGGVGRWVSESECEVWGDGNNKLPFVLVGDVAAALVRGIQVPGIEGRSYNLIDEPLLTARDYLNELQEWTRIKLNVRYRPIWRFYCTDLIKWSVKLAVRHPDRVRIPSYRDWESRTQKARFDCGRAMGELGWVPASDRERLIKEGIGGSSQSWLEAYH